MTSKRKKAIIRQRIFVSLLAALFAVTIALVAVIVAIIKHDASIKEASSDAPMISSEQDTPSADDPSSNEDTPSEPEIFVTPTGEELDADFGRLLLVNGKNPLPQDYDKKVELVTIDDKYINGFRNKINAQIWPYAKAMIEAAWADGVELYILSPYRSYEAQKALFEKQVEQCGGNEEEASTVVARPGTSEHNTGLCADFNMVEEDFENTPMFEWLCENGEDYGFILRYPEDKQDVTGVIYESWHWRFVGINNAKKINQLGVTLEEYIEMKDIDPTIDMYTDDSASPKAEQIAD